MTTEKANNIISEEKQLKFVFFGSDGCGKSNLINALVGSNYEENNPSQLIDFKSLAVKKGSKVLKITFWDTPRQISFFGPTPYYRGADLIGLVIDSSIPFEPKKINDWLIFIERDNPSSTIPIILILCKADIEIPNIKKDFINFSTKEHYPYFITSAKLHTGIDELLSSMVELALNRPIELSIPIQQPKQKERCQ
ncbi:hypothetical protein ENUP19_0252G0024 [Entamoeba nuttalli]|uniref:Rab family GTPase n=2 Tax=Entamoeba nuttalli TaxID=412467 RepID=K2G448_ENTNP|nr:Rab family GTPase [Entamoeba nuttalli P19]EKE37061.1 Rab family GTPase [Entamoeba nuttalli P19]|eukprot:XP_008860607.1 Rab family GTPase [Entamoeba nuttalli P19]